MLGAGAGGIVVRRRETRNGFNAKRINSFGHMVSGAIPDSAVGNVPVRTGNLFAGVRVEVVAGSRTFL
jgi:hypothetical protein